MNNYVYTIRGYYGPNEYDYIAMQCFASNDEQAKRIVLITLKNQRKHSVLPGVIGMQDLQVTDKKELY